MMITRRNFMGLLAAPAIVSASSFMPISSRWLIDSKFDVVNVNVAWLEREMQAAIWRSLTDRGPVYWNGDTVDLVARVVDQSIQRAGIILS